MRLSQPYTAAASLSIAVERWRKRKIDGRNEQMKLVKEIEILLGELLEADQPTGEMARQVMSLIRQKDLSEIIED